MELALHYRAGKWQSGATNTSLSDYKTCILKKKKKGKKKLFPSERCTIKSNCTGQGPKGFIAACHHQRGNVYRSPCAFLAQEVLEPSVE